LVSLAQTSALARSLWASNEHNALIPRDHWLEDWEKRAIIDFYYLHPLEGYRRVTFMMLDVNVVAAQRNSAFLGSQILLFSSPQRGGNRQH